MIGNSRYDVLKYIKIILYEALLRFSFVFTESGRTSSYNKCQSFLSPNLGKELSLFQGLRYCITVQIQYVGDDHKTNVWEEGAGMNNFL